MDMGAARGIYSHPYADKPRGHCVLCDGRLGGEPEVYAGTNHDGSGRLAHARCWDNMVAQMWWSFRVSVHALADKELQERKSARPKLGKEPEWGEHLGDMTLLSLRADVDKLDKRLSVLEAQGD